MFDTFQRCLIYHVLFMVMVLAELVLAEPMSWPSSKGSSLQLVGRGFEPRPIHTKDF